MRAVAALAVVWVAAAVLGVQVVAGAPVASPQRRGPGLRPGHQVTRRHRGRAGVRQRLPAGDPFATRPAADLLDRAARQGRHRRLRRELRAGRRPGLDLLAAGRRGARRRHRASCARPASPRAARSSPRRRSAASAGWPTRPAVRAVDRQPAALRRAGHERPVHAERRVQAGRLAHGRRRAVEPPATGRRARRSTTTTRSTTPATSATRARSSATRRCPTSTCCRRSSDCELAQARPRAGDGRDRPGVEPHAVGAAAAAWSTGTRVGDGSVFDADARRRRRHRPTCGATPTRCGRPTGSRSSTRSTA